MAGCWLPHVLVVSSALRRSRECRDSVGVRPDNGEVNARLAESDYQLLWPRDLFRAEAAKLLNLRELPDWNDRCELLLEDAFGRGYEGGARSEFCEV